MSQIAADSPVDPGRFVADPGVRASGKLIGTLAIAFVAAIGLYLSTLSKHYSEGEDGASYVIAVTRDHSPLGLYQPNHLMFAGVNRVVYRLAQAAGYAGDASIPMKVVNALAGASALCVLLTIMRRLGIGDRLALVWAAITAVSYAYWSYSTQPETYAIALPFLLLSVLAIIDLADGPFSPRVFARLGLFNALTTLFQQMHVLIYPLMIAAVVAIWYRRRSEVPARRLLVGLVIFGGLSAMIVGVAYFAVALGPLGLRDLGSIIHWSKGHGNTGPFSPIRWYNPLVSVIAIGHAVLGGHFLYGIDAIYGPLTRALPHKLMVEERYLALQLPMSLRLACLAASGIAAASGLAFLLPILFAGRDKDLGAARSLRFFASDAIIWPILLVSFAFNTLMEPTTIEWWVGPTPLAAIGIASLQARRPSLRGRWLAGAIFAGSLLVANGFGCILPQADLRSDYWYQTNQFLIRTARPGDTILTDGGFISDTYLDVYTGARVISVHFLRPDELERVLSGQGEGRVWVSSWAFDPPEVVRKTGYFDDNRPDDPDVIARRSLLEGARSRMVKRDESLGQVIWELLPP